MKRILKYISIVASVALVATSCNLNEIPSFDENDAFIAFDNTTMAVNENAGIISIPVTLASISGISTTAAYTVSADGDTAAQGEDYSLVDPTGIITFSSDARTAYIEINIIEMAGEFTGDKSFTVSLSDTGSVDAGASSSCVVTIQDLDHPLSSILGTYTVAVEGYWDGAMTFNMTITKDESDVTMVYFANIAGIGLSAGYYGTVNDELTEIYVPMGQIHPTSSTSYGDGNIYLYGCTSDLWLYDEGNMVFDIVDNGTTVTLTSTEFAPAISAGGEGYFEILLPPYVATKVD